MQEVTITKKEVVVLSDENVYEIITTYFKKYNLPYPLSSLCIENGKWVELRGTLEPRYIRDATQLEQAIYYIKNHFNEFLTYEPYRSLSQDVLKARGW